MAKTIEARQHTRDACKTLEKLTINVHISMCRDKAYFRLLYYVAPYLSAVSERGK